MANRTGPRSAYDPKVTPTLILWMCRSGLTGKEIAENLEICEKTLYTWRNKYPEVKEALLRGKDWFDATVEHKLFQSAIGYRTKNVWTDESRGENGELVITQRKTTTTELPPNITAIIWWQKNRQPDKWRDKHEVDLTGNITIKPPSRPEEFFPACPGCNGSGHVTHLEDGKETEIECSNCRGDGYVDPV